MADARRPRGIIGIEHIGIVPRDLGAFERFWCGVLGFSLQESRELPADVTSELWALPDGATARRYALKSGPWLDVLVCPGNPSPVPGVFDRQGYNHICLAVDDLAVFLDELPGDVRTRCHIGVGEPGGVFVHDYEGNWIEVVECS
jgi:catechol 2,3-dioxygenase-like lactoylglutathione lyase family enzyme